MSNQVFGRFTMSLFLLISIFTTQFSSLAIAQRSGGAAKATLQALDDLQPKLKIIEEKVEARRRELGIPGMSLAIVKDDRIIFLKGLGFKDFEKQIAVTPDTQFAIGSATKAFTALSVLMTADEGKLSLEDNPRKHLSYFKINDPEIDSQITIRDLLAHSSGLNRTDLAWASGKLNREEVIRVAGEAKPTAKLREKFQYQNVMFAAAGEIVAATQKTAWEKFVVERIFKPLEMNNSTMTTPEMQNARDYSFGYEYNFDTKETRRLPTRDLRQIAPAGSINSSARDMANWLRFVLSGGSDASGRRLVSEKSFEEWLKPQMKIGGKSAYGLGWFVQDWKGLKIVQHGGNIDGFNSMVAMIPEKRLGFVMLTNVSGSSLGGELMSIVWENLVGNPSAASSQTAASSVSGDLQKEIGKYRFEAAGFDLEIKMQDGKLIGIVPGQPVYTLEKVGGRKYKLAGAPEGFFITFKDTGIFLEQPQGNYTLPRIAANADLNPQNSVSGAAARELVGKYQSEQNAARSVEIVENDGKITLRVEGQPPYELRERERDLFSMNPLPDEYRLKVRREATNGKLTGIAIVQPEGEFAFRRVEANSGGESSKMSVDELMPKVIEALGGEANWRKLKSRVAEFDIDFVHQGVKGTGTQYAKAPNLAATESSLVAFGKTIATFSDYFNGAEGGEEASFAPAARYTGKQLEDARLGADFYGWLNWKTNYKKAEIKGTAKVGGEEAFVIVFEPEKANKDTVYFSTKTFLPLKLESFNNSPTQNIDLPYSEIYSDYRSVDGVMIPFKTVNSSTSSGDIVTVLRAVRHNPEIPDSRFHLSKK